MTEESTIASRMKLARKRLHWSQETLGAAAGLKQSSIGNIESGRGPSYGSLPAIAAALGVSLRWLMDGEGEMEPAKAQTEPTAGSYSDMASSLANMFDMLPDDPITRAQTYNQLSEILIRELRPVTPSGQPTPEQAQSDLQSSKTA